MNKSSIMTRKKPKSFGDPAKTPPKQSPHLHSLHTMWHDLLAHWGKTNCSYTAITLHEKMHVCVMKIKKGKISA